MHSQPPFFRKGNSFTPVTQVLIYLLACFRVSPKYRLLLVAVVDYTRMSLSAFHSALVCIIFCVRRGAAADLPRPVPRVVGKAQLSENFRCI